MEKFYKGQLEDFNLKFDDSVETKDLLFDRMLAWFVEMESFNGECIMQSDEPQIEAAPFLSEVAEEIFKFEVTFADEKNFHPAKATAK